MKQFEFHDDSLKKSFETLKRIPAPEKAVINLYRRISEGIIPHAAGSPGALRLLYMSRKVVMTAVLTLLMTVPATFFVTKQVTSGTQETKYIVRFIYKDENAQSVDIIGDFNNWGNRTIEMNRIHESPFWTADVALSEGAYKYVFLVNGSMWIADPLSSIKVTDDYGHQNSLIVLLGGEDADRKL